MRGNRRGKKKGCRQQESTSKRKLATLDAQSAVGTTVRHWEVTSIRSHRRFSLAKPWAPRSHMRKKNVQGRGGKQRVLNRGVGSRPQGGS